MTDERINQLIEKHKKYAENAKATVHMCDDESSMLTDALNYWQECDDVISCLEELKRLREVYDELDKAHGDLFIEYSNAMKALLLACDEIKEEWGGSREKHRDQYLKKAREQEC